MIMINSDRFKPILIQSKLINHVHNERTERDFKSKKSSFHKSLG